MSTLNHRLKDALQEQGKVALSSGAGAEPMPAMAPAHGPVTASVPKVAGDDPLLAVADTAAPAAGAKELAEEGGVAQGNVVPDDPFSFTDEDVVLTEDERNAFLDSVVAGTRYQQRVTLFNGRVTAVIRARATAESEAIAAHLNMNVRNGAYESALDYGIAVRNAMLAAHIAELNGMQYPILQAPLYATKLGETVTPPGWLSQASIWSTDPGVPEAVVAALYEAVRLFERKYWTMVAHAHDQNFWQTAESTSK